MEAAEVTALAMAVAEEVGWEVEVVKAPAPWVKAAEEARAAVALAAAKEAAAMVLLWDTLATVALMVGAVVVTLAVTMAGS